MKYFVWIILIGAVIGGGFVWYQAREKAAAANAVPAAVTRPVVRRTIEKIVSANGKVQSNQDVDIKCRASGEIIEMPFDVSAEVKPGELLLKLDDNDEQQALKTAQAQKAADVSRLESSKIDLDVAKMSIDTTRMRNTASLASAEANAASAKSKWQRTLELFNQQLAAKEEVETAEAASKQADAQVLTQKAAVEELKQQEKQLDIKAQSITQAEQQISQDDTKLKTAQDNIDYCKVFAPENKDDPKDPPKWLVKTITANVRKGYLVQSGTSGVSGGTTVMTLSDMSHIYVLASVDESDFGQIAQGGQKVRVTADSYPGEEFEGKVVRVATAGVTTSNVTTYEFKIEVTSENRLLLRPEMTATAKIIASSHPDVIAVPTAAFVEGAPKPETPASAAGTTTNPATTAPAVAAGNGDQPRRGGRGGGRGGQGRGRGPNGGGGGGAGGAGRVMVGTAQVVKDGQPNEVRPVTVIPGDDDYFEVIKGLDEGEMVLLVKSGADSRFRNPSPQQLIRGMTGGGGGGGGRGR